MITKFIYSINKHVMTDANDKKWVQFFKSKKLIAIDPGKAGGIAIYCPEVDKIIALATMPETPADVYNFLKRYQCNSRVYMELVHGLPKMGGAAMFNFGKGFGHLEMCLVALGIPVTEVRPQEWQKSLGTGSKGQRSTNQWKTHLKEMAQKIWPYVERDFSIRNKGQWLSVSDALLILEFARLKEKL